jgi:hypothetical protein
MGAKGSGPSPSPAADTQARRTGSGAKPKRTGLTNAHAGSTQRARAALGAAERIAT